ncbi:Fe2+-enterobactin ABC transporter substrate-binding protein [Acerihabitans arboris]|uniref:Ferric enterobactin-binding periplasmic protein FepB n=1 Tax=Acerihabitans arboris TaxID=2691583 RepID=A0A845SMP7_9GAMM|nr:Fe2+-enterobactin ABC transporter substrate-binding protein [Acerihabitans arboris]NDL63838.1 Fe2+-enterobactin ABC transporter substrate-binding protein [Acerihabitans arboris]
MTTAQSRRRSALNWLALAALSCLLAAPLRAAESGWPRQVAGTRGAITLERAPQRIVSTSVTLTGTLLAIGAPVVASGATTPNNRVADEQGFFRQWAGVAKQRGVRRLYIGEPDAEAIAGQNPDLIIIAATGGDSALRLYDQLSPLAPTLVVNYDDKSWQDLARELGQATGHEAQALAIITQFDVRQQALKQRLALPPQPVSALVYQPDGKAANLWTADSSQGQLLRQLGFQLAEPPKSLSGGQSMGKRKDIVQLSGENLATGLNGQTFLLFANDDANARALLANPFLAHLPAVQNHRVYALGNDTFRLDYYSASNVLARLEQLFVKP